MANVGRNCFEQDEKRDQVAKSLSIPFVNKVRILFSSCFEMYIWARNDLNERGEKTIRNRGRPHSN